MLFLASQPVGAVIPFREIATRMDVPQDFLAKIFKRLVKGKLAGSMRGAHGGYSLGRPASEITFLDVIEAVEGPVKLNLCTDKNDLDHSACSFSGGCTMLSVWRLGQERMLEVYRHARLDKLAMTGLREDPIAALAATGSAAPG